MKKTILATVLLSGLVLSVAAPAAYAAPADTSRVEVELTKDGGYEPSPGPYKDHLTFVHKPTVFKFSSAVSDGSLLLENQHANKDSQYLVVNDDRKDDSGASKQTPWTVTGKLSKLTAADGTELNAKLNLIPGEIKQYNIGLLETVDGVEDYKAVPVVPDSPKATEDYTKSDVSLQSGSTAVQFLAKTTSAITTPKGVFTNLGNSKLAIAAGNGKNVNSYSGYIDWVLAAQ